MNGIAIAGTVLVDRIYGINAYPREGELAAITSVTRAPGGLVPNVAADIKTLAPEFNVLAMGRVGDDADGRLVKDSLASRGIDIRFVRESKNAPTGFTEVMSVTGGERTFFTCAGANAQFGLDDVAFDGTEIERLHLGYFFLLDKADGGDGIKILREAEKRGIKTSIDLVTSRSGSPEAVKKCLPYVDDLIVNGQEAAMIAGADQNADLTELCEILFGLGVNERVIIHEPAGAVCRSKRGFLRLPSLKLPKGYIKGTTGAGDAFTAGALVAAMKGYDDRETLELASMSAAAALSAEDAVGGMKSEDELKKIFGSFGRI